MIAQYFLPYWHARTQREQYFLWGVGLSCLIFFVYLLAYLPLHNAVKRADADIISKRDLILWMQEVRPFFNTRILKRVPSTPLLGLIEEALNQSEFQAFPVQLNQVQNNEISIQFAEVPFSLFLHWFWKISEQYQFDIKKLTVQKMGKEGRVRVSVVLTV